MSITSHVDCKNTSVMWGSNRLSTNKKVSYMKKLILFLKYKLETFFTYTETGKSFSSFSSKASILF